ncbi:Glycine cleavage system T protein (Aminomethyltransferase) [Nocardioides sp. PD653]|nr:Glycine cleavage system T protein (Aminomethyltransferase) [Nocardioides sp. PD653-B2]GAW53747.1 Glycine cleavage system T protein (Aminomethyltransferase) [Nocardioides sp. PD653]
MRPWDCPTRRSLRTVDRTAAHYNQVLAGNELIGFSNWTGYTVNHGHWISLGMFDTGSSRSRRAWWGTARGPGPG